MQLQCKKDFSEDQKLTHTKKRLESNPFPPRFNLYPQKDLIVNAGTFT